MNRKALGLLSLLCAAALLAACSAAPANTADQIATSVAATLAANGQNPPPQPTANGEIPTQSPQEASCANSGLVSVAYLKEDNVWLWTANGQRTQLTNSADAREVRISGDGCQVAFSRALPNPIYDPNAEFPMPEQVSELWVVNSDGSNAHALVSTAYLSNLPAPDVGTILSVLDFKWQPGTHTLAFNTQVLHPGVGLTYNQDLYSANADTGVITPLLAAGQAGGWFGFSPDGQKIALTSATNLHVVNADGSNLVSNYVTFLMVITYSEYLYTPPAAWTPGSNSLMLAVPPADGLALPVDGVLPETALWWVPLDGTPPYQAGAVQAVFFVQSEAQFSPDAGRVAYLRPLSGGDGSQRELVVALSDGSNESPTVTAPDIRFLVWAADNARYIYTYNDDALHLMLANVSDANVQPISTLNSFPSFSAEAVWVSGDEFVLLEKGDSGGQLSLMNISGAGQVIDTFAFPGVQFDVSGGQ
jgi:hypothetical protein